MAVRRVAVVFIPPLSPSLFPSYLTHFSRSRRLRRPPSSLTSLCPRPSNLKDGRPIALHVSFGLEGRRSGPPRPNGSGYGHRFCPPQRLRPISTPRDSGGAGLGRHGRRGWCNASGGARDHRSWRDCVGGRNTRTTLHARHDQIGGRVRAGSTSPTRLVRVGGCVRRLLPCVEGGRAVDLHQRGGPARAMATPTRGAARAGGGQRVSGGEVAERGSALVARAGDGHPAGCFGRRGSRDYPALPAGRGVPCHQARG